MTDITEQGPRGGALIYTESAYKNGQMKARGAIVADMLMELQAVESQAMRHGDLYSPRQDELLPPDLSDTPTDDLCALMLACGMSNDPSDKMFVKACRDELAKRKPAAPLPFNAKLSGAEGVRS